MTPDEVVRNAIETYIDIGIPLTQEELNAVSTMREFCRTAISLLQDYQKWREKITVENIETEISVVFADYALNGQGSRNLTNDLSSAIVTYLQQPTEH